MTTATASGMLTKSRASTDFHKLYLHAFIIILHSAGLHPSLDYAPPFPEDCFNFDSPFLQKCEVES